MRELFRYEWRTNRRSFVIWTIIIVLFQMMFAGFGDLYMSNEDMLKLLEQFRRRCWKDSACMPN